jgi:hypothetical protein
MSDLTVAVSADVIRNVFKAVVDEFQFEHAGDGTFGRLALHYDVAVHFSDDATNHPWLDLRDDGTVYLHDLELRFAKLELTVGVDLPEICVGGFGLLWVPIKGWVLRAPRWSVFGDNPDFSFTLALDKFVTTKLSVEGAFEVVHWINPARLATDSDWDAHRNKRANEWRLTLQPKIVHWEPLAVEDTVGNLFDVAIKDNIDNLLGRAPGWAKNFIAGMLVGMDTVIRDTLGLGNNVAQWVEQKLNGPFGLPDLLETAAADFFANKMPVPITQDPVPLLEDIVHPNGLIPIMLPIATLEAHVSSKELILEGSLG